MKGTFGHFCAFCAVIKEFSDCDFQCYEATAKLTILSISFGH
jgi:hypothetical protein